MSNTDARRVEIEEERSTLISPDLASALVEISDRLSGVGFVKFIRVNGLISRTEVYRDAAFTNLSISRDFTRVLGATGLLLVSGVVTKFFELDGVSADSMVSSFIARDLTVSGNDYITYCSGYFSTTERIC